MTVCAELGTYLVAQSVGVLASTIFEGRLPDAPDQCLALIEYGGFPPQYIQELATVAYEQPSIQVLCRAATFAAARALAEAAYAAMAAIRNTTLSGTRYLKVTPLQPPFLFNRDGNERTIVAFNAQVLKAVS